MPNTHRRGGPLAGTRTHAGTHISIRLTPGGFDTCWGEAAEVRVNVWTNLTESLSEACAGEKDQTDGIRP